MSCCSCAFVGETQGGTGFVPVTAQRFAYTVTGAEPDLSHLTISLPAPRLDALYLVWPAQADATNELGMHVANASRTINDFVLSLSADATAGDVFVFLVDDPV